MKKIFISCLLIAGACLVSQAQINVSSFEQLLSVKQDLNGGTADVTVELASGTYFLTSPLVFTEADGRTGGNYVTYKAAPGAKPVISGGYLVTGTWQQVSEKPYYQISIPVNPGVTDSLEYVRNLYVNGRRARRGSVSVQINHGNLLHTWSRAKGIYHRCQ